MSRGWDRSDRRAAKTPEDIFDELNRRELADIETCRHVWEGEDDPLAVVVAVIHAGLPKWLTDALLVLLTDGAAPPVPGVLAHRKKLWRDRTRAAIDATRAWAAAGERIYPGREKPTWEHAFRDGENVARKTYCDIPPVSPEGAKRAWQRVMRGLRFPWRFYRAPEGTNNRILRAWESVLESMLAKAEAREGAGSQHRGRKIGDSDPTD